MKTALHMLLPLPLLQPQSRHLRVRGQQTWAVTAGVGGGGRPCVWAAQQGVSPYRAGPSLGTWRPLWLKMTSFTMAAGQRGSKEGAHAERQPGMCYQSPRGEAGDPHCKAAYFYREPNFSLSQEEFLPTTYIVRYRNKYDMCLCVGFFGMCTSM